MDKDNIFEGAELGDRFLTREGSRAVFVKDEKKGNKIWYKCIVIDIHGDEYVEYYHRDGRINYSSGDEDLDIVSRRVTCGWPQKPEISETAAEAVSNLLASPEFNIGRMNAYTGTEGKVSKGWSRAGIVKAWDWIITHTNAMPGDAGDFIKTMEE